MSNMSTIHISLADFNFTPLYYKTTVILKLVVNYIRKVKLVVINLFHRVLVLSLTLLQIVLFEYFGSCRHFHCIQKLFKKLQIIIFNEHGTNRLL